AFLVSTQRGGSADCDRAHQGILRVRIGLNGLNLSPTYKGGVNSFAFGLFDAFAQLGKRHTFVLFTRPSNGELFEKYREIPNFKLIEIGMSGRGWSFCNRLPWRIRYRLPSDILNAIISKPCADIISRNVDVHFVPYCPPQIFPLPTTPTVYSIHDIQHVHF